MKNFYLFSIFLATYCFSSVAFAGSPSVSGPFSACDENRLTFSPVTAKFVRLHLEPASESWSPAVDEIEIFGPEFPDKNLAVAIRQGKASASGCIQGYAVHRIEHLIDGRYGNERSWVADPFDRHPFICIELPTPTSIGVVVFSKDRSGQYVDRLPKSVFLETSLDGKDFRRIENIELSLKSSNRILPELAKTWANIQLPAPPAPPTSAKGAEKQDIPKYEVCLPPEWPRKDERGFENLALNKTAIARTSSSLEGYDIHRVEHLNDGKLGNDHSWIAAQNPCWAEIDLGDVYHVCRVAFGSDSSGRFFDRGASAFSILLATEYAREFESRILEIGRFHQIQACGSPEGIRI